MAKKKVLVKGEPGQFSKLNDFLNTIAPMGEMLDINPIAKIDEWIGTGSYILNAALSGSLFGGLPNRRSLVLAGEEGCLEKNQEIEIYTMKSKKISQTHDLKNVSIKNSKE
jgi:hypothetical protein